MGAGMGIFGFVMQVSEWAQVYIFHRFKLFKIFCFYRLQGECLAIGWVRLIQTNGFPEHHCRLHRYHRYHCLIYAVFFHGFEL